MENIRGEESPLRLRGIELCVPLAVIYERVDVGEVGER